NRDKIRAQQAEYNARPENVERRRAYNLAYREAHRDHLAAIDRRDRVADPRKGMLAGARRRARIRGLEFNLTIEDLIVPDLCPILGIPLVVCKGKPCDGSPSLDRIDNDRGYTRDNVRVISYLANTAKNNMSDELLIAFCRNVLIEKGLL